MVSEETLQAVRAKAEFWNGGASLGEDGDRLAETAVEKALAYCQRRDVPRDMEQAVGALALALYWAMPRSGEPAEEEPDGSEGAGDSSGTSGVNAGGLDWEALLAAGAVKSVQRGDTAITFRTGAEAGGAISSALSGSAAAHPTVSAALADLAPWRRLGRLKREEAGPCE